MRDRELLHVVGAGLFGIALALGVATVLAQVVGLL
jgi:hypothetical protein